MALNYHFDLYPRTDPLGARLVRFTNLQSAQFRGEANGTGSGEFTIRADDPEADFIDPLGLQYVRVVRDDDSTELVVGGFFLERGEYKALDEDETKLLKFGGAGPLTIFQRAVMDADSWIDDPFIGTDPQPEGVWPLYLAGTGNELGAILWRVLHELEEPGRHQDPLPFTTLGFTHLIDSNAAAWVRTTGDFSAQVSESVLSIVRRLMQLGLYVEVDPDTFEVRAFEPETHRRDRTGGAWAADVVRFQAPTAGDILTGNIKSDATRALEAVVRRNAILTGSADTWLWVDDPGVTVPWEGGFVLDDDDGTSLLKAGEAQLALRGDAGDSLRLRMRLGDDEANGVYLPFEHVLLDDLVTVHTGTGQWDYNEAEFPVAALTISLRPAGDWDCWADLGSSFLSMAERAFQAQPVGAHTHPPNPKICRDGPGPAHLVATGAPLSQIMEFDDPAVLSITTAETLRIRVRWADLAAGADDRSFPVFRWDGPDGVESYLLIKPAAGTCDLWWNADETDPLDLTGIDLTQWTWFLVENHPDYIQAKVWQDGDAEPGSWGARAERPLGNTDDLGGRDKFTFVNNWVFDGGSWDWQFNHFALTGYAIDRFLRIEASDWGTSPAGIPWTFTGAGTASIGGGGDSCIHGGPLANSGDGTVACGKCVAAGNHEHDYVATGGTTGQVLVKVSGADWDTEWEDASAGVTDHGALTGLADDDHPQYATNTEFDNHDARHANGGADELAVESLPTAETDTALVLHPDGAGGIEWGTDEGGGGGGIAGELVTDTIIGDGATDTFALSETPSGPWALVSTNGADLLPSEYAIVVGDIVFDDPPETDAEVLVTFIAGGYTAPATDPGDIADPTLATAEDVALKLNALMAELRTAGIIV